jgi:hypothetical protein
MSTSPEPIERAEDQIVNLLSQWLARHVGDLELRERIEELGTDTLSADQAEAVEDVVAALRNGAPRGELEVSVREALEALALG